MRQSIRYLSDEDVQAAGLPMGEVISAVETAFREKGHGRVEMPAKLGIHPAGDGFLHAMPAFLPGLGSAGMKWVAAYPSNAGLGLPQVSGLIILNDPSTGLPKAILDATWITAMRTGAATAVAAKHLARPDSSRVAILGCGVQGRTNLRALCEVLPIASVAAYDVARGAAERYAEEMAPALAVEIQVAQGPQAAVRGADVVVTAGPIQREAHRTIEAGWIEPGAFVSAVDYDSYFQPAALHEMHKFCTDDVAQLEVARSKGHFPDTPPIHAEIGELVAGLKPGRESPGERTMTANLGLAIHDMAVAPLVVAWARERGLGVELPGAG